MKKHKIIKREKEFIDHDTIGYMATCSCGKKNIGWSEQETEENAIKHIKEQTVLTGRLRNVDNKSNL